MGSLEAYLCNLAHAVGSHVGHVDAGCQRAERVVRADVGAGPLAADVLLPGGQGENKAPASRRVVSAADETPWEAAHEVLPTSDEADVRAPVTGAQAKLLAFAGGDVGAVFARRGDDGQADGIDAGDRQRAEAV